MLDLTNYYRSVLRSGIAAPSLESTNGGEQDPPEGYSKERKEKNNHELKEIVKKYLDDDPRLQKIADEIIESKEEGFKFLNGASTNGVSEKIVQSLESIVRTDGSRPSFLIRQGVIDFMSSPRGVWQDKFFDITTTVEKAVAAVGRINCFEFRQGFAGTGFLVGKNLIMTNRHVLQGIAKRSGRKWEFKDDVHIDFGKEFRGIESANPRQLKSVAFCHQASIDLAAFQIDHTKLDLVLIELEPGESDQIPLAVDISNDWAEPTTTVFTVGYPGDPGTVSDSLTLLEQLFQSTFGKKRLAPGEIIQPVIQGLPSWTLSHDATTLGGNSGSCIIVISRSHAAAGLHYGGTNRNPRSNWGHIVGKALAKVDEFSGKTLTEVFDKYEVKRIDRTIS